MYDIYVKINNEAQEDPSVKAQAAAWFKRMEDGDEEALKNWRVWREMSIKKYEEEYARLNVRFDVYTGESQVGKAWQAKALERLTEMNLIDDHEGAKLVNLEQYKMGKAVLRKKGAYILGFLVVPVSDRRLYDLRFSDRWNFDLPHARYRRRHREIREIQL